MKIAIIKRLTFRFSAQQSRENYDDKRFFFIARPKTGKLKKKRFEIDIKLTHTN